MKKLIDLAATTKLEQQAHDRLLKESGVEKEFTDCLPERIRTAGLVCYREWLADQEFNTVFERSKATLAYMTAAVEFSAMMDKEDEAGKV